MRTPSIPAVVLHRALIAIGAFNALSAIGGGIGLLTPGSMGIPSSTIADSPFSDFTWPGILLIVVIGGTQLLAALAELRRARRARFWTAVAGFGMVIWIFVELAIMGGYSVLHGLYFATGALQLVLVLGQLGVLPGAVEDSRTA